MRNAVGMLAAAAAWIAVAVVEARADDIAVFNTGVGADRRVLAPGVIDQHYWIVQAPATARFPAPAAAFVASAHPSYVRNDPVGSLGSSWIAPTSSTTAFHAQGDYAYRTTFDLTGLDPATARIVGALASDDLIVDVRLNGVSLGIKGGGFTSMRTPLDISLGFVDGVNTLDFVVRNAGASASASGFRAAMRGTADPAVRPDTTPPVLSGCADWTFESQGADVELTPELLGISALDDVDGAVPVTLSPAAVGLGSHVVTATATDAAGNAATATFTVDVVDTTAPEFVSLSVTPDVLDARGHRMAEVTVSAVVSDACDPAPAVRIVSVASSEAADARGSGRTAQDWEITGDLTADLRAERSGTGAGRVYTLTVEATDASGNSATATVEVLVPHDNGRRAKR